MESHHGRQGRQGRRLVRGEGGGDIVVDFDAPLTRFAATHVLLEAMTSPLMVRWGGKEQELKEQF